MEFEAFSPEFSLFRDPIIAPLWTHLMLTQGGSVFYRVTNNQTDLNMIASLIANATFQEDVYNPQLAIIVTWEEVSLFQSPSLKVSIRTESSYFQTAPLGVPFPTASCSN